MILTPKNWASFQHYKDRSPVWIKLHRRLLDDPDFHCLPLASRALAPMLWLLASEYQEGRIDCGLAKICWRLRVSERDLMDALNPLIEAGLFEASDALASRKQDAMPRREEKRQRREEGGVVERARATQIDLEEEIAATYAKPPSIAKSLIGQDAFSIAAEVLKAMGKDPFDPISVGAPLTVQSWLNGGWNRECILVGVKMGMQSRSGDAPGSLKYFEKAIARAHAELTKALPVANIQPGGTFNATTQNRPESLGDVANRLAVAGITFGPKPTGLRSPESGATHELVPQG